MEKILELAFKHHRIPNKDYRLYLDSSSDSVIHNVRCGAVSSMSGTQWCYALFLSSCSIEINCHECICELGNNIYPFYEN